MCKITLPSNKTKFWQIDSHLPKYCCQVNNSIVHQILYQVKSQKVLSCQDFVLYSTLACFIIYNQKLPSSDDSINYFTVTHPQNTLLLP